jgi:hypothetical protein
MNLNNDGFSIRTDIGCSQIGVVKHILPRSSTWFEMCCLLLFYLIGYTEKKFQYKKQLLQVHHITIRLTR